MRIIQTNNEKKIKQMLLSTVEYYLIKINASISLKRIILIPKTCDNLIREKKNRKESEEVQTTAASDS